MRSSCRARRRFGTLAATALFVLAAGCDNGDDATPPGAASGPPSVTATIEPGTSNVPTTGAAVASTITSVATSEIRDPADDVELPERFDAKQVTVTPAGADGLRVREVVDQDFGSTERHGYERVVPDDLGRPTDVTATSPDAPATLSVTSLADDVTQIRIGDPAVTITGQHRYTLSYTLPAARLTDGTLALDVIGTSDTLETGRLEIVVAGFDLQDPVCDVGTAGSVGGCTLARDGEVYRAVIGPLLPGRGVTIGGTITGRVDPVDVPEPALPPRR